MQTTLPTGLVRIIQCTHHHLSRYLGYLPRQTAGAQQRCRDGRPPTQAQVAALRAIAQVETWLPYDGAICSSHPQKWTLVFKGTDDRGKVRNVVIEVDMSIWARPTSAAPLIFWDAWGKR